MVSSESSSAVAAPTLSVVVPTRQRPHRLPGLFESMAAQTVPRDRFELIIVDDGGAEGALDEVARPYQAVLQVRLLRQESLGPGAARNAGAAQARGVHLVFTADDCQPAADWLATLERRLRTNPGAMIGGRVDNGAPEEPFATCSALLLDYLGRSRDSQATESPFFTPNNLAVPRDLFLQMDGFDVSIGATGEDRDFSDRWLARGWPMVTAPEVVVRHTHPHTLASFWRQHVSYGRGSRRFYRARAGRGTVKPPGRVTPEPLSFYLKLVRYPFTRYSGARAWVQSGLMMVAQAANLVGFVMEGGRDTSAGRS